MVVSPTLFALACKRVIALALGGVGPHFRVFDNTSMFYSEYASPHAQHKLCRGASAMQM